MTAPAACNFCAHPASLRCSGCSKVFYCDQECQKNAWSKHKHLCKLYQNAAKGEPMPDESTFCGTCGKSGGPLTKTTCCGRTICDDEHLYKPFSFSKVSCLRNHTRYTACGYHKSEGHKGHWHTCYECRKANTPENRAWYRKNNYNFLVDIEDKEYVFPQTRCAGCTKVMKMGPENHSKGANGVVACQPCTPRVQTGFHSCIGFQSIPGQATFLHS
ncbi:hypothetical protein CYLTODRAFT_421261 [Cylindrobasidium torrendii FP15055 ss-10]|uniref:MYND-type domain-containing protein n=1 Tax=Cylindrobasidium torrendii FP15055 ss-10 TaxID=1314674 RepID=A0A0D7BEB3_9AGAR|nr:hypothetical protein CYLTODRAFT_421261 [Cylindrobasidium torrendii FP15055 ss-10]